MSDHLPTRETLLMRIQNRSDESSWEDFLFYYRPYILAVLKSMNLNPHDREDLLQEVMLKSWKALAKFTYDERRGRFRSWLATVTKNTAINFINKKKRNPSSAIIEEQGIPADIEKIAEYEWKRYIAELAWKNIREDLSSNVQQAFDLYLKEVDPAVIAETLGIERNSVYVYKKRVLRLLKTEIQRLDTELN